MTFPNDVRIFIYLTQGVNEISTMMLSSAKFNALALSRPAREAFGPGSPYPYLAFDLQDARTEWVGWVRDLPCPVIGIGEGELAKVCDVHLPNRQKLEKITRNISQAPIAAMILVQHLRASENLSLLHALTAESFAYAAIQHGPEFQKWLASYAGGRLPQSGEPCLQIDIQDETLNLTLNRPDTHNAIGVEMRDVLCEVLDLALSNSFSKVTLTGSGSAFSTGGAIEEFGEVSDPATAHWVRSLRLPAWRLARLTNLEVHVNGAAIGAGAEIAAFGTHVTARPKAWFQLPELKYGLIPGAGGTASIPRRIGRQRTAYMALSMDKVKTETALDWGLIDAIVN